MRREKGVPLFDMQGACSHYVLTSALYGARHDLRLKILGTCKMSDTPLGSLSYHCVTVRFLLKIIIASTAVIYQKQEIALVPMTQAYGRY